MARLKRLLQEVHQRSLWQLLASYIVGAWLVLQIAETIASLIGLPLWFGAGVIALLAFGLVLVLTTGLVQVVAAYRSAPDRSYSGLRRLFSWKHALMAGLVALAVLVVGTGGYMGMRVIGIGPAGTLVAKGVLEGRDRIVLADLENHTNDSTLALAATEALRVDLDQSRVVRVAETDYVERVLQRMERSADEPLDYKTACELAIREGLQAVIAGEVRSIGDGYMLSVRLVAPESGEVLTSFRETATDASQFASAIDRVSSQLRERVGESLRTIRRNRPLEQVTTRSLAALRRYSAATRAEEWGQRDKAIALLEEAVTIDTTFAMAYRKLGALLRNRGHRALSLEAKTKTYEPIALVPFYAVAGRPDSARAQMAELEAAIDLQELRRHYRYNHARANLALAEGRTQEVEEITRQQPSFFFIPLLGRAYDLAAEADSAIAVYERYVAHTEDDKIMEDAFHLAWTYERLAYLYEQRADTANAIRYYAKLVDLWKNADPELQPRVEAARRAIEALSPDR